MSRRLIVCTVGPLPLKRTRAQTQFDSVVVTGWILKAVYRQLECVHDVGLNEVSAEEGAGRGSVGVLRERCSGMYCTCQGETAAEKVRETLVNVGGK